MGNAAEHVTAVIVSYKGKMDLAMGVAIGSSMQIALLVTPALVILGWIIGQPMTLRFETFETVVFFLSVLVVNCTFFLFCLHQTLDPGYHASKSLYSAGTLADVLSATDLIQDSQSNYLEGAMLLGVYIIMALAFYVYPESPGDMSVTLRHVFALGASNA